MGIKFSNNDAWRVQFRLCEENAELRRARYTRGHMACSIGCKPQRLKVGARAAQPRAWSTETSRMQAEEEPFGGIAVVWEAGHLMMLFDAGDAWLAWNGQLVHRVLVGLA
jgi:hypothetical protein